MRKKNNDGVVERIDRAMIPWYIAGGMLFAYAGIPMAAKVLNCSCLALIDISQLSIPLVVILPVMYLAGVCITIRRVLNEAVR